MYNTVRVIDIELIIMCALATDTATASVDSCIESDASVSATAVVIGAIFFFQCLRQHDGRGGHTHKDPCNYFHLPVK